jgi:nucleoside-diphosphate-sugar epimerase
VKVLLVGGSGMVGTFITPYLRQRHDLRVLDVRPPSHPGIEYVQGSIANPDDLTRALHGCDAFIDLVMRSPQGGGSTEQSIQIIQENYEVNALGVHLLLYVAQGLGIKRGVYTSSMSVHFRERKWYSAEEQIPLDTPSAYGLSKGFGELICQYFARWFDMNLIALRITGPRSRERYLAERRNPIDYGGNSRLFVTDEEDLANAYLGALDAVQIGHGRFDAVFIAGDEGQEEHNLSKAKRLLGWEPRSQRYVD